MNSTGNIISEGNREYFSPDRLKNRGKKTVEEVVLLIYINDIYGKYIYILMGKLNDLY